tara:strand:- start:158 stop:682 length:525 start_codon:yes stop_codon:yes gene_type:complete
MADYYVDNNSTIYASAREQIGDTQSGLPTGNAMHVSLGLSDLTDLSGQSSIYVNKITFQLTGFQPNGGTTDYMLGHFLCGIIPTDKLGTEFSDYDHFQDIKGWPLKASKKFFGNTSGHNNASDTPQNLRTSFTYSPRSSLLINREQSIIMTVRNDYGDELYGVMSIDLVGRRGD